MPMLRGLGVFIAVFPSGSCDCAARVWNWPIECGGILTAAAGGRNSGRDDGRGATARLLRQWSSSWRCGGDCGDLEVKMLCAFWVGLGWVIWLKSLVYLGMGWYARVCALGVRA